MGKIKALKASRGVWMCLWLAACGAGGGLEEGPVPVGEDLPAGAKDSMRFLTQATFGPSEFELNYLNQSGFEHWFQRQKDLPPSLHRPKLAAMKAAGLPVYQQHREELWWKLAVEAPDQLRQRMAFALSQILVLSSQNSTLQEDAVGCAAYYDLLVQGAFGNYRDLLEQVTLSPQMGIYLSMIKNQKPDLENDIRPDENYAREVMQLFSIGLVELEPDGSVRLDQDGQPIPTYDQADIENLARAFTGWTYAGASSWEWPTPNTLPMQNWSAYHDFNHKEIVAGVTLPAFLSAEDELDLVLDTLFEHPNTGPFIARRLIQRFVSSNPSPGYISRVAAVFANNGQGVRGDLWATLHAVLMDQEARQSSNQQAQSFGKLKEPIMRLTQLWRAFDGRPVGGVYKTWFVDESLGQSPLSSPSVFNFFQPDYQHPGTLTGAGLVAPEFQITDETRITLTTNALNTAVFQGYKGFAWATNESVLMDLQDEIQLAGNGAQLVDHLALWLAAGSLDSNVRSIIVAHVNSVPMNYGGLPAGTQRVLEALYLLTTAPDAAVQL
jgi:uncharacterized protein (DUF1800 family)